MYLPTVNPITDPTQFGLPADTRTTGSQTLDQKDFLKLLVAQLTSQDPMNPESNLDFSAQMAQFSTLQATTAMQSSIAGLGSQQQLLQANDLIGRTLVLQNGDKTLTGGAVSAVTVEAGTPKLVVNGQSYTLDQVLSIAAPQPQP